MILFKSGTTATSVTTPEGLTLRVESIAGPHGDGAAGDRPDDAAAAVVIPLASWTMPDLAPLAEGRRLIAYDPRGRGGSDPVGVSERVGFDADVADLETVRAAFGLERMVLVGWSYYGGMVARYARAYPARIARLVQLCPIPLRRVPWFGQGAQAVASRVNATAMTAVQASVRSGAALRDPERFCRTWHRAMIPAYATRPDALDRMRAHPCRWPNEHPLRLNAQLGRIWQELGDWDWRADVAALDVPRLVLHADGDFQPRASAEEWAMGRGAQLEVITGAGHLSWLDRPDEVLEVVARFVTGGQADGRTGGQ
ncbi:MAG TPA: alpha/beta hydrolase [Gemmatimonadales bacterium]|nr:alpha/beta hydrolase [Gemmatimonadales bacterium]